MHVQVFFQYQAQGLKLHREELSEEHFVRPGHLPFIVSTFENVTHHIIMGV
jgi:hypothetical protein